MFIKDFFNAQDQAVFDRWQEEEKQAYLKAVAAGDPYADERYNVGKCDHRSAKVRAQQIEDKVNWRDTLPLRETNNCSPAEPLRREANSWPPADERWGKKDPNRWPPPGERWG